MSASWEQASELRRVFDAAFAAAPSEAGDAVEPMLLVNAGGEGLAVAVPQLAGLEKLRSLLALPAPPPHLLGLAGLRGRLLPVFSLASLLGRVGDAAVPWLLLVGQTEPIGLAFAQLDGLVLLPRRAQLRLAVPAAGGHARAQVEIRGAHRPVIDIQSLCQEIRTKAGLAAPKER
jgi:purine-binding chemotaxis protein CheW